MVTQNITLADASFLSGQHMTESDITDMDDIQSSVQVCWHFPLHKIHYNFAGWSGFSVPRSDWSARIYDDQGKAFFEITQSHFFGFVFGAFVVTRQLSFGHGSGFVTRIGLL